MSIETRVMSLRYPLLTLLLTLAACGGSSGNDGLLGPRNQAPTANAGADQTVSEQTAVNLDGSASGDSDGSIATFSWTQTAGTVVALNGADTATPDFTAPAVNSAGETLTFQLRVTDNNGGTASDTVGVTVNNDPALNPPPNADAGPDQTVTQNALVTLDGTGSADDGAIATFQWTQTAGTAVTLTNADQAVTTFTSPANIETLTFQLEVTDDEGASAADTVDVTVSNTVTISGTVTFSEIPQGPPGAGLDYGAIVERPARLVTVQAIDATDDTTVLATTRTDANGAYGLGLAPSINIFVRVRAEMIEAGPSPSWNFRIVDNTAGDAMYVLDTNDLNTGASGQNLDILAETAFDGNNYTVRSGAPFAILDAIHDAFQTVLTADATIDFEPLNTHWSVNNTTVSGDESMGEIGTSFYRGGSPIDGIYLLGDEDVDTEEYDQHIITHEWGHYYEDTIARSDSIGGAHTLSERLDVRLAFGEGFGNAWSAIATGDTLYLDTLGNNQSASFGFDVEDGTLLLGVNQTPGWYSERSVQEVLYDLFDATNEGGAIADSLSLGWAPIHEVLVDQQRTTTAFTSIFSFIDALKADRPVDAAAIDALLAGQSIAPVADEFGTGETNDGGIAETLPVYKTLTVNGPAVNVCSNNAFGNDGNELNVIQFVRFTMTTPGSHTVSATATDIPGGQTTDPDIWLRRPPSAGIFDVFESQTPNSESGTTQAALPTGDYILEVFDFNNRNSVKLLSPGTVAGPQIGRACFDITVTQP